MLLKNMSTIPNKKEITTTQNSFFISNGINFSLKFSRNVSTTDVSSIVFDDHQRIEIQI